MKRRALGATRMSTLGLSLVSFAAGCSGNSSDADAARETMQGAKTVADTGEGVRLALTQVLHPETPVGYETLVKTGSLVEGETWGKSVEKQVRDGLLTEGAMKSAVGKAGETYFRRDTWKLGVDYKPAPIAVPGTAVPILPTLRAGTTIEMIRPFASEKDAKDAKRIPLWNLPVSAEAALALPEGTYVAIPTQGRFALGANGTFVQKAWTFSKTLGDFLKGSATGAFSATAQGTVIADGDVQVQVVRLGGTRVRLRLVAGNRWEVGGKVEVGGKGTLRCTFLPLSNVTKARELKRQWKSLVDKPTQPVLTGLGDARKRVQLFRDRVASPMKLLLDSVPEVTDGTGLGPWLDRVESVNDEALALSQRADVDLATLETAVKNQVQRAVDLVDSPFKKFVEPALSKATALGDRSYEQSASVALDAGYTQAVRGLADYILDLGSEEGREAFERAVGFRTAWLGRDVAGLGLPEKLLSDFVVADGLATEDLGKERPRVERVAQAMSDVSKSHTKIVFSGLALQTGFEEKNENQGVFVEDESGRRTSWRAHVWEFTRSQSLFGASEREALRSGFLAPGEAGQEGAPVYWFQWTKDFGPHDAEPVKDALAFVLNEVGPRAVAWGVPSLYAGELPGRISANLSVAFSGPALDRFFDADVTSDALVWQALGRMAETYDNQFGLPFAASPRRPTTLVATPGASEACERVAKQWGGLYCFYIEEELLPALRRARGGDALARMQFFRGLYTKGFLANKVGSRMLVRLVHETLYANGTKDGIYTKVAVSNGSNDGASASPTLVVGESPEGDVMEGVSLGALPK